MKSAGDLVGIEQFIEGKWRFIGKVGRCPQDKGPRELRGHLIFYKDAYWTNLYSTQTKAISIAAAVIDKALELGVQAFVVWVKDKREMVVISADLARRAPRVNLGQVLEIRVRPEDAIILTIAAPLDLGYTRKVIRLEDAPAAEPSIDFSSLSKQSEAKSATLFDL